MTCEPGSIDGPRPPIDSSCQTCGGAASEPMLECCACRAVHHERCWRANRGCSVRGCGRRSARPPEPPPEDVPPAPPAKPAGRFQIVEKTNPAVPILALTAALVFLMAAVFLWFDGGEEWVPLHVFGLGTSLLALLVGRFHRLHVEVDPPAGVIRRHRTLFGIPLSSPTEWIRLSEAVELHLHRGILHDLSPRPASNYALYALLADGTRRRILFTHGRHSLERERALIETAEYIATIADCTVRLAFDGESLSRAEIARILEQRHASSTPSPARLDEPKPADEGPATVRTKD